MIDIKDLLTLKRTLRCNKNGKFKILVLSDIHGGKGFSKQVPAAIEAIVAETKPDLVIFNGDTAGFGKVCVETVADLEDLLTEISAPMEKRSIPWAHTFGNHDDNGGLPIEEQEPVYESYPCCVSKRGDPEIYGVANYVLPVLASEGDKIVFNVFSFDSHCNMYGFCDRYGLPRDTRFALPKYVYLGRDYDSINFDQISWYFNASRALEAHNGAKIPALACMHVPVPEYCLVVNNKEECGYEGTMREDVGCAELNSGFFSACLQRGDIKAIVSGHDHINDFCGSYCGIKLTYDAGMDYNCYQHDDLRGGRIFEIDEKNPEDIVTYMVRIRDIMGAAGDNLEKRD